MMTLTVAKTIVKVLCIQLNFIETVPVFKPQFSELFQIGTQTLSRYLIILFLIDFKISIHFVMKNISLIFVIFIIYSITFLITINLAIQNQEI